MPQAKRSSRDRSTKKRPKAPLSTSVQSTKRRKLRSLNAYDAAEGDDNDDSEGEGAVKPEDDEDIDSDEAFESGDEEKFSSFNFSSTSSTKRVGKRTAQGKKAARTESTPPTDKRSMLNINLDEDEDDVEAEGEEQEEAEAETIEDELGKVNDNFADFGDSEEPSDFEEEQGEEIMDLSELLGGRGGEEDDSATEESDDAETDEEAEKTDKAQESGTEDDFDSTDSQADEDDHDPGEALQNFITNLDKKKTSAAVTPVPLVRARADKLAMEDNEQKPESEYNLTIPSTGRKLRLEDMLRSMDPKAAKTLAQTQTLPAPLARPIRERTSRAAAYETAKEQITKWQPAVKALREATVLRFPLDEPARVRPNNNSLASTFKPSNDLETEIANILKSSGMVSEKQLAAFEDFEMGKLTVEEVQKRRDELRLMRDLMFRQERKAKRVAKIKSKSFRRVHRKEKEKIQAAIAAEEGDPAEAALASEERRARERMELRHKNTGKWAQKMLSRADHGEGSRAAITEQIRRGEELSRRVRGDRGSVDGTNSDRDEEEDEEETAERDERDEEMAPLPQKGLFGMKFMRDADKREAEAIRDAEKDDYDALQERDPTIVADNVGRRSFAPGTRTIDGPNLPTVQSLPNDLIERHVNDDEIESIQVRRGQTSGGRMMEQALEESDANPWITLSDGPLVQRSSKNNTLGADSNDASRFAARLAKSKAVSKDVSVSMRDAAVTAIEIDVLATLPYKKTEKKTKAQEGTPFNGEIESEGAESEGEGEEGTFMSYARGKTALKQADLVAQAFAGDNVVAAFEREKQATVSEDAPREEDLTLPGWGTWTGQGVKKRKHPKRFTRQIEGVAREKRKDASLRHVVINEKRIKATKSLMAPGVPFPYESKEQYERSLRLPVGPEWATRSSFQKNTMPKVIVKRGHVIDPMSRPFK